jgi:hypothetical protein
MAIIEISGKVLLAKTRRALRLPDNHAGAIDPPLVASLLRRAAGILCPCSASTLASSIVDSLQGIAPDVAALQLEVETAIEALIVSGDLLELSQVATDDPAVKGTWLFAAPPAFVRRSGSTSVFLVGIASDDASPLPETLKTRIRHEGMLRVLAPDSTEDLPRMLRDCGLAQLSEQSWLKMPKAEAAAALKERFERQLAEQLRSGEIADLLVLDGSRSPLYYKGRWISPRKDSGTFVARRPQAYGADLWGFARLSGGEVAQFLDLPLKHSKWRGCDTAWHLQMAIDHCRGTPQQYRLRTASAGAIFDFFSPLPLWAERRLGVIGRRVDPLQCLYSYWIPESESSAEESFLRERLWLTRKVDQ